MTVSARRLRGTTVNLSAPPAPGLPPVPSVTGTSNLLCAAAVAEGETVLQGAAREPEVVALGQLLIAFGARIEGLGAETVRVVGVRALHPSPNDAPAAVVPGDRIEAATWMIAAAATGGRVVVDGVEPADVRVVADLLQRSGVLVTTCGDGPHRSVRVTALSRPLALEARSAPFPGLPTDVTPQLGALAAIADGTSFLTDDVFPGRIAHLAPLAQFGASIRRAGAEAVVGGTSLQAANVQAPDLRAAAALLIAALAARGTSRIGGASVLLRGYERPVEKLCSLGATVSSAAYDLGARPANRSGRIGWRAPGAAGILRGSRPGSPEPVSKEILVCSAAA